MNVLIAGAGGPLGRRLVERYLKRGDDVAALVLRARELQGLEHPRLSVVEADVTRPETLRGVCDRRELLVSCIGITRLKGRLTHEAVDYAGNLNLMKKLAAKGPLFVIGDGGSRSTPISVDCGSAGPYWSFSARSRSAATPWGSFCSSCPHTTSARPPSGR